VPLQKVQASRFILSIQSLGRRAQNGTGQPQGSPLDLNHPRVGANPAVIALHDAPVLLRFAEAEASDQASRFEERCSYLLGEWSAIRCASRTNAARAAASSMAKKAFIRSRPSRVIASG